ncbi:unnamed protein product [Rotaria sp. Silwood1]|nr:unnamed protein product [Rotaria sp. Silwood1]
MHLVVYNYGIIKKKIILTNLQRAQDNAITQLCYNHNANFIAVGYSNGELTLCGRRLYRVSVYPQNLHSDDLCTFLGLYCAHYKPIRPLFFGSTPDDINQY